MDIQNDISIEVGTYTIVGNCTLQIYTFSIFSKSEEKNIKICLKMFSLSQRQYYPSM